MTHPTDPLGPLFDQGGKLDIPGHLIYSMIAAWFLS